MKKITKKDITRVENSLKDARAEGNAKRITFLEATLAVYQKELAKKPSVTKKDISRVKKDLVAAKAAGNAKQVTFLEATLNRYNKEISR